MLLSDVIIAYKKELKYLTPSIVFMVLGILPFGSIYFDILQKYTFLLFVLMYYIFLFIALLFYRKRHLKKHRAFSPEERVKKLELILESKNLKTQTGIAALILGIEERITYWSRFRIGTLVVTFLGIFIKPDIEDGLLFLDLLVILAGAYMISHFFLKFKFLVDEWLKSDLIEIRNKFYKNMIFRKNLLKSVTEIVQHGLANVEFDLFVFGSQANKDELIAADIDLGIKTNKPIEPIVLSRIKHKLNDELPSLYTFDVVDFSKVDASFAKVALQNIEHLHNDTSQSQS
ncbi:MAG: hypothetical protein L3J06_05440 [Cyclobacteriaceae bacterium]|nr:hypothetical protein [Cyclobacteriaceae bacterium]